MKTTMDTLSFLVLNAVLAAVALLALVIPACCAAERGATIQITPAPPTPLTAPAPAPAAQLADAPSIAGPMLAQVAVAMPLLRTSAM